MTIVSVFYAYYNNYLAEILRSLKSRKHNDTKALINLCGEIYATIEDIDTRFFEKN